MIFTDPFFLFAFLPLAVLAFYQLTKRFGSTAGLAVIFGTSLLFYAPWGRFRLLLLVTSVTVNFIIAQALLAIPDERQATRWRLFVLGESLNFAALVAFKYQVLQMLLSTSGITGWQIAIPIGISFYTFHQAAFLADAYARDASTVAYVGHLTTIGSQVRGYIRYAAFVTFFPQLVIGPITYLKEFQPQAASVHFGRFRQSNVAVGVMLIVAGMFKKVVIADSLGTIADPIFAAATGRAPFSGIAGWVGIFAYYAQLYFDFSGYSDMAMGIARVFGMRFPVNFFSPLKAVGIIDFYRRWHMTLTRVISRFLYTPLSLKGTRFAVSHRLSRQTGRVLSVWIPLFVNFEVIALWHGATSTFVAFGLIHGVWYVLETEVRASRAWKQWRKTTPDWVRTALGRAIFVVPMALTFALFRSNDLGAAKYLASRVLTPHLGLSKLPDLLPSLALLAAAFGVIYLLPNSIELTRRWRPGLATYDNETYNLRWLALRWRPDWAWTALLLVLTAASFYFVQRQPPFLYMGF